MPPDVQAAIASLPPAMRRPLLACARGEIPANIALMHLCMAAPDAAAVESAVNLVADDPQERGLAELGGLWRGRADIFRVVKDIAGAVDHGPAVLPADALLDQCARAFDRAARLSSEGSVALYSLGDPALLSAATAEIAAWMRAQGLLGPEKSALEIGCGNGRFLEALAGDLGHITGLDISGAMIADALRRCAHLPNVTALRS
jgi:hypothetical protein